MSRYHINVCGHTHVQQLLNCLLVTFGEVKERFGPHEFFNNADTLHALLEVSRVAKVIKRDDWVIVDVCVVQN